LQRAPPSGGARFSCLWSGFEASRRTLIINFDDICPRSPALPPATSSSAVTPMPALFNTQEIFHGDPSPFKQWGDMIGRTNSRRRQSPATAARPHANGHV
jgi:hypothetical protein